MQKLLISNSYKCSPPKLNWTTYPRAYKLLVDIGYRGPKRVQQIISNTMEPKNKFSQLFCSNKCESLKVQLWRAHSPVINATTDKLACNE